EMAARGERAGPPARPARRIRSVARMARTLVLGATWAGLIVVWASTCLELALAGSWAYALLAGADVAVLAVLFLAEGMELAVTDLLDKDPEQVGNVRVRAVLHEIQARRDFFLANRQVFVVAVIAFMSQSTVYPWLFVPGAGRIGAPHVASWFSFALTTLTVLWFAQVLPKRLAIRNSELFLDQSRPIWPLIRLVGVLGLP